MAKSSTVVIIPTYNEAENIKVLLPELLKLPVDILIVDDASSDGTADVAKSLGRERLTVISRPKKLGLGSAYKAGYKKTLEAGCTTLIQMDADGSHRVKDLENLLIKFKSDSSIDLLIGSRWIKGGKVENWPKHREYLSRFANKYSKFALGAQVQDMTSGFRIYRDSLLASMKLDSIESEGYSFQIEMTREALRLDAKIVEVPITFIERTIGSSKMSSKIVREAMMKVSKWGLIRFWMRR
jgi:dolichol-phosphate mannosyltransferase